MSQKGFSFLLVIGVIFLISTLGLLGFKAIPAYIEYYYIHQAFGDIQAQKFNPLMPDNVRRAIEKRFEIDDIKSISAKDIQFKRVQQGYKLDVSYNVPIKLSEHISFILHFSDSTTVKRNG